MAEVVFSVDANSELVPSRRYDYVNGPAKVPTPWRRGRPHGATQKTSTKKTPPEVSCEFITVAPGRGGTKAIDTEARSKIRRHAKLQAGRQPAPTKAQDAEIQGTENTAVVPKLRIGNIPTADPFDAFPAKLEPYMLSLLKYYVNDIWKEFYKLEAFVGCNPMADFWMPMAFQDPALLHTMIGCADAWITGYSTSKRPGREVMHLHQSISIVNERLQTTMNVASETTIAIVAGMALLEKGLGRHEHWRIHMRGLRRLVDMIGGLYKLSSKPLVLYKIYRADLYGALDAVETPFFPRSILGPYEANVLRPFRSNGFNAVRACIGLDDTLCLCIHQLEEAMQFWERLRARDSEPLTPLTAAQTRHLLTQVQYTLISPDLQDKYDTETCEGQIMEYCRISLILYTLTVLRERPPTTSMGQQIGTTYQRVVMNLIESLRNHSADHACTVSLPLEFHFWTLFLASNVMRDHRVKGRSWVLETFEELASMKVGIVYDWQKLETQISAYLWIPEIHEASFATLRSELEI
ncbi:hypothetical protein GGR57DRAFT_520245 [Xylariaceae sp. FL1272]|nr:hypothetical protein GGR57DRAFT_520245 [Xylariaceae sp. FL1272]